MPWAPYGRALRARAPGALWVSPPGAPSGRALRATPPGDPSGNTDFALWHMPAYAFFGLPYLVFIFFIFFRGEPVAPTNAGTRAAL